MKIYIKPETGISPEETWLNNINQYVIDAVKTQCNLGPGPIPRQYIELAYLTRDQLLANWGARLALDHSRDQHYIEFARASQASLFMIKWA